MRRSRTKSPAFRGEEGDPLSIITNLFDVAMAFAVALIVAVVINMNMTEVLTGEDFTIVKNPGKENMEIITREGKEIQHYTPSDESADGGRKGKRVGVAYELEDGRVIYVPE